MTDKERIELELNRRCNEMLAQLNIIEYDIKNLQMCRADNPASESGCTMEERLEIMEKVESSLRECFRPLHELKYVRVLRQYPWTQSR